MTSEICTTLVDMGIEFRPVVLRNRKTHSRIVCMVVCSMVTTVNRSALRDMIQENLSRRRRDENLRTFHWIVSELTYNIQPLSTVVYST